MMRSTCYKCKFFHGHKSDQYGECHRHAPKPLLVDWFDTQSDDYCGTKLAVWPAVVPTDNCGEFVVATGGFPQ